MMQHSEGYGRHHGLRLVCNHRFSFNTPLMLRWNNKRTLSPSGAHGFFQVSVPSINVRLSFRRDFLIYAMKSYKPRSCVYTCSVLTQGSMYFSFFLGNIDRGWKQNAAQFFLCEGIHFHFLWCVFLRLFGAYAFKILNSFGLSNRTQKKHLLSPLGGSVSNDLSAVN